jgi:hypothetical protein
VIESVVAGRSEFVAQVCPTVKAQSGGEPRVASDPRQAFGLCAQSGGLLVLQYDGPDWLPVVRDLRSLCGDGISLVVTVPAALLGEVRQLQHAGADEVVPWEGKAEPVGWAIQRALAARGQGSTSRTAPTPVPPVVTYVAPAGAPPPVLQRGAVTSAAPAPAGGAPPAAPSAATSPGAQAAPPVWPANLPGAEEAAALLAAAVSGAAVGGPQAEAALKAAQRLSQVERDALAGAPLPVEPSVVRKAAVLRFRVALALATVPQQSGAGGDGAAVQALLAEIDGVLAELKALEEGAPEAARPGLDAIRSGLVSEAIDLTEAVQRLAPQQARAPEAAPAPVRKPAEKKAERPARPDLAEFQGLNAKRSTRTKLIGLLVLAAIAAAGYHIEGRLLRKPKVEPPTMAGAPAGSVAPTSARSKHRVVMSPDGKPFDSAQVERFKKEQADLGKEVVQVSPTTLVVRPAAANQ